MMKKLFASLLCISMLVPNVVSAADEKAVVWQKSYECDGDTCEMEVVLKLEVYSGDDLEVLPTESFDITMTLQDATFESVEGSEYFDVDSTDGNVVSLVSADTLTVEPGDSYELATFYFTYPNDEDTDCSVSFATIYGTTDVDFGSLENSQTGVNIPLVALGVAGVLAVGVYLVVGKKNKIYNV